MSKNEQQNSINDVCRISSATFVKGVLRSQADIRIDGKFEGDIVTTGKLVLGDSAVVDGTILCASADISGTVNGDLSVKGTVSFKSSAKYSGNLKVMQITIDAGARFEGTCAILDEKAFAALYSQAGQES